ncbi:uncharacterized protein BDV17DRAFT_296820 [Aspergillus undulatus]|uniref:uncharacterized protein n=1 Tax=Aspergillus undulatus TaxID=1810928 RepID=UPI003CCD55A3
MGANNILEASVITPEDLFWAVRGGGSNTFSIILSLVIKVYPMPTMLTATVTLTARNGTSAKI